MFRETFNLEMLDNSINITEFSVLNNSISLKLIIDNILNKNNMRNVSDLYNMTVGDLKTMTIWDLYAC